MNVKETRKKNLCVSCEICSSVCLVDCIEMEQEDGQFLPLVGEEECIECGKCLEVCPGIQIETPGECSLEEWAEGPFLEAYSAYTKDREILKESTSGGVVTQLIVSLLEDDEYDGAFVLPFEMFCGEPVRLQLAGDEEEVKAASKSKYLPASVYNVVEKLQEENNPNYIIVGTSCQIRGIKNYIESEEIKDENLLFLGLFCDKTLNFNFLEYFEDRFSEDKEQLEKFDYRNKGKDGWPGHPKMCFDSNRVVFTDRNERIRVKKYFQLERCLYCLDKLNRSADISFGDCYITGKDEPGRSSVIVRTEKGKEIWDEHKDSFHWEESSMESIKKSQSISEKKENLDFLRVLRDSETTSRELSKRKKYIEWGRKCEFGKIDRSVNLSNLIKMISYGKEGLKAAVISGCYVFFDFLKPEKKEVKKSERT